MALLKRNRHLINAHVAKILNTVLRLNTESFKLNTLPNTKNQTADIIHRSITIECLRQNNQPHIVSKQYTGNQKNIYIQCWGTNRQDSGPRHTLFVQIKFTTRQVIFRRLGHLTNVSEFTSTNFFRHNFNLHTT